MKDTLMTFGGRFPPFEMKFLGTDQKWHLEASAEFAVRLRERPLPIGVKADY